VSRTTGPVDCVLCRGVDGDGELGRLEVWSDDLWRLTTSVGPGETVRGFSYLEPRRHIPDVTALDGREAQTFGGVIGRVTAALKEVTGAVLVYVYVFGGHVDHLHVHLGPHVEGDSLNDSMIRGDFEEEPLPSGAVAIISKDFPAIPEAELRATAEAIGARLAADR
jgi:diadenosine tetraphosphate (Ap4A) HIT family hydrolase